jgi:hypothetical protein
MNNKPRCMPDQVMPYYNNNDVVDLTFRDAQELAKRGE